MKAVRKSRRRLSWFVYRLIHVFPKEINSALQISSHRKLFWVPMSKTMVVYTPYIVTKSVYQKVFK